MVSSHVLADRIDDLAIGLTPGDEPALALDDPGHDDLLLLVVYAHAIGTMLA